MQQVVGVGFQAGQLAGDRQQPLSDAGHVDLVAPAMKKLDVMQAFQRLDLGCQGRLAQPDGAGGRTEAAMLGNGKEGADAGGGHP
ncbi:hypothetical protein GCM10007242_48340 [Pigmentiphaga litoralis]|nr:hypothetical protein GCM10007242_48340 [Pigmentiphaga litoralis]